MFFSTLKIMLIIGLIIGGIVINAGGGPNHEYLGFRYWRDPGAFKAYIETGSAGRFLAFWKVLLTSAFSYGNIQVVAISGSETRNPRKIIPSATRKTFLRVFLFYVLMFGLCVMAVVLLGADLVTGATATMATLGNVGPGFGLVGPMANYGHLHPLSKLVLTGAMWIGRLEVLTVLALIRPEVWRSVHWQTSPRR